MIFNFFKCINEYIDFIITTYIFIFQKILKMEIADLQFFKSGDRQSPTN
jgi:hypothetical protein